MAKAKFTRNKTTSQTKVGGSGDKEPQIKDLVELFQPKADVWYKIRLVGPVFSYGVHWIAVPSDSQKARNGRIEFSRQCLAWDDELDKRDSTVECPYCELPDIKRDKPDHYPSVTFYQNILVRKLQDKEPEDWQDDMEKSEASTGFKNKDSDTWTPIRVLKLPSGAMKNLRALSALNEHGPKGNKQVYDIADEEYGIDIRYKFDPEGKANAHSFQTGEHTPLTEQETEYLLWNIEDMTKPKELEDAQEDAERILQQITGESSGKSAKRNAGKKQTDYDDEDEDEAPAPKSKKPTKPAVDDDEEDEEYTPPAKKSKKPVVEDDDDEDDVPVTKSKKKQIATDDFDDDEEDVPAPKSKKPTKPVVDADDDEDEPAPKKPTKKKFDEDDEDF